MRALVIGVVAAMALSIGGCGSDDDSPNDTTADTTETTDGVDVPDIVGDSVDEATTTLEDAGLSLRVVRIDGEDQPGTADYVPTRVNVAVETEDGTQVVTEVVSVG